jgi:hypothetical protein
MRAICFGETDTEYSWQMSDVHIHLLAQDVPCAEFKYTNIENILTVQIRRWMECLDCFAIMIYGFYIDYSIEMNTKRSFFRLLFFKKKNVV